MESSSKALSPLHEALATDQDDTLSDVIDITGRLNIDSAQTQSNE